MRLFGTSGIRAVVDNWLINVALKAGLASGRIYKKVVIGCDSRTSSDAMKSAVTAGLLASGAECYDIGLVPTPTLALAVEGFDAGIMITASHNPPEYNGIKMINPDGSAFSRRQQQQVEELICGDSLPTAHWKDYKSAQVYHDAVEKHIAKILGYFSGSYKIKVVLDCDCGAGSVITPQLLERMGCDVVKMNCQPGGLFPHEIEPKEENLADLMQAVKDTGADLGIAHDGDADRMMAVDDLGRFISGDKLLLIMAEEIGAKKIITTLDASMAVEEAGFEVARTAVGDNCISEELKNGGEFGGEPSGSWVVPANSLCPDGIYTAALMVSIAAKKKLSKLVDDIPGYEIIRGSVGSSGVAMEEIEDGLITAMKPKSVNRIDGIRLSLDGGWLLVRASGTEPKIRITAESRTREGAQGLYNKAEKMITKIACESGKS